MPYNTSNKKNPCQIFNDPYFIWPATLIEIKQNEPLVTQHYKSKERNIRA